MADNKTKTGGKPAPKTRKIVTDEKTITVEQYASPARREQSQTGTLIGLGLNKLHRRRVLQDTPAIRGMIVKVRHMVRVVEG